VSSPFESGVGTTSITKGDPLTMPDLASPLLDAARFWFNAGFCVIPSHEDGGKRPFGQWKKYQTQRPDWPTLEGWLQSGRYTGIGLIMGQASGNAEMLEIEGPGNLIVERVQQLFDTAHSMDLDGSLGLVALMERIYHGCAETSAGGGLHIFVKVSDGPVPGNTKLAGTPDKVIAETRGEGGFVIVWPTPARNGHEPEAAYLLLPNAHPDNAATVTASELEWIHAVFTDAFGGWKEPAKPVQKTGTDVLKIRTPSHSGGLSPFDDYRQRVTWRDILEPAGWTWHSSDADHDYWTRPGKDKRDGHSASTIEDGPFYLFSSSVTGMPIEQGLSKGQVYAHLHHDGDLAAATRQLRADGYGDPHTTHELSLTEFITSTPANEPSERERTSWWPRNLAAVIAGHENEPDPTHLTRGDGPSMFYSGRVNGLIGESESGKTWVALHATSQELAKGQPVLYLDFEDSAPGIINRLRKLGTTDQHLAHLTYIAPDETLSTPAKADLGEALAQTNATLVIIDGFNAAMTLMGLDINSNNDATQFAQVLLKPIAATGACVVYVDHVPKSREARGKGGIGAQAKRAMTTGCALTVTVTEPFGEGQAGRLHLTVDKDRPGKVRARSYAAKHAGDVVITPEGRNIHITIQPSDKGQAVDPSETQARRELIAVVKDNPGASQSQLEKLVKGGSKLLRGRLDYLVHLGKLQVVNGPRSSKLYYFIEELESLPAFEAVEDA
jgi:hypothetical protein